jgi:hypothetical protein
MRLIASIPAVLLSMVLLASSDARAATEWLQVGEGDVGRLSVKTSATHKQGDGYAVVYRLDFPAPQRNKRGGKDYLSTEIQATVFCKDKSIARYELTAYSGKDGTGEVVGGFKQSLVETRAQPIDKGGSDEDLWRFLCAGKPKAGKK